MKKFKKMIAALMSVAMIVCMFAIPASAATVYDKAVKLSPMELASGNFKNTSEYFYKITLADSGKITFYCSDRNGTGVTLLDANGNTVIKRDTIYYRDNREYDVTKKGTYYLKLDKWNGSNDYFNNFYYGFKPNDDVTISLSVTIKVGEKLDLSAITSNYKGNVTWKTTKSAVATVSKGTVTAKKKGTAQIRAYMNNGDYAEITVKVTK